MTRVERQTEWTARVADFRASGQSVPAWCALNELKPHQLRYWLRKNIGTRAVTPSTWLSLNVCDLESSPQTSLTIRVGQAAVEVKPGFDPELLLDVVRTLSTRC